MAVLASDLVQETRAHIKSGTRDEMNRLTTTMNTSVTSVVVDFALGSIVAGAVLSIDLELMLVWSSTGSTATVQRNFLGTVAAAHTAGALIYVNPQFTDFQILRAVNAEIASYSSPKWGLYQMKTVDLTYSSATVGYDLTSVTDLIDVYELRWKGYTTGEWPMIRRWSLARNMATSEFASGLALLLDEGAGPGKTIRVRYKAPFAALTLLADDVQTIAGFPSTANDIPPLGAAARLIAPREVKRAVSDSQPESRAAAEVPPGTSRGAAATLLTLRDARLREESSRLQQRFPTLAKVS